MRINRFLAQCGIGSRRSVEKFIQDGCVKINDIPCENLATEVRVGVDCVTLNNRQVRIKEEKIYLLLNKPKGYIVTKKDEFNRKTVYSLIPEEWHHLFPIGRLDRDSEGLLLMTNDGVFAQKIIHPRFELPKTYKVVVNEHIQKEHLIALREGVVIDGKKTLPARIFVKDNIGNGVALKVVIYEGRNRQIRKMFEKFGYKVTSLKRLQIVFLKLDKVPSGMFRMLKPSEVTRIMSLRSTNKSKNANYDYDDYSKS